MSEERDYTAEVMRATARQEWETLALLAGELARELQAARERERTAAAQKALAARRSSEYRQRTNGKANRDAPSRHVTSRCVTARDGDMTARDESAPPAESELFVAAWEAYPRRSGSNPRVNALKQWLARVREGVAEEEMLAGTRRYRAFCDATDKTGTEIVMQAQRFFGRSKEFGDAWDIPVQPTRDLFTGPPLVDGWLSPEFDRLTSPTGR